MKTGSETSIKLSVNLKYLSVGLLVVIVAMLAFWGPWSSSTSSTSRVVKVTGDATVKAAPDAFQFSPTYEFKNADKAAALADMSKRGDEITKKLKELGVSDKEIQTNSNGYSNSYYYSPDSGLNVYNLQFTVTTNNKELAQKVQDYLVSTAPIGTITPYVSFSKEKQKQLESQARDLATKQARDKADQSAKNLGFRIGKVKSIDDSGFGGGCGFGGLCAGANLSTSSDKAAPQMTIQSGENELTYSVTVEYYIR